MRKSDLIRKNMVQSIKNERNILAMANNPFVVRHATLNVHTGGCGCYFRVPPDPLHLLVHSPTILSLPYYVSLPVPHGIALS